MLTRSGSGGSCGGGGAQAALRGPDKAASSLLHPGPQGPGPLLSWVQLHHPGAVRNRGTEPTASPPVSSGREQLQARKMRNSMWTASPTGLQGICYLLFSGFNLGPSVINQLVIPADMFN